MSDNIPLEIQVEIIKKLPIKPLIQFRSVSKTWRSLIDSSQFIADYHQQAHLQHHFLVGDNFAHNYVSFVDNDTFPCQKNTLTVPKSFASIVGCSQGLFCFHNYNLGGYLAKKLIIWNPTIRKSVDVVVPKGLDEEVYNTVFGFGVCPRTLDPMLVKISNQCMMNTTWLVEVFRLSLGVWKSLSVDLPPFSIQVRQDQVLIDKFIYWLAFDAISCCDMIMSFDMTSEAFTEMRLPDSLLSFDNARHLTIRKLKESLVVLQYDRDSRHGFGVWMMDNRDPKSFEKIYTIKSNILNAPIFSVLAFRKNGEPIVILEKEVGKSEYELFVYERNSRHVNHIGFSGKQLCFKSYSYKETLLLLDH